MLALSLQADTPPFAGAGAFAALGGACVWAMASVMYARVLRSNDAADALRAAWFKNVFAAAVLGLLAWALGTSFGGGAPVAGETSWLILSGLCSMCIGDWLYFAAIAHIGIGRTVIITMSTPALTALLAWPIHHQQLYLGQWLGIAFVVGGGILAESHQLQSATSSTAIDRKGVWLAIGTAMAWTVGNLVVHDGLHQTGALTGGAVRLAAGAVGFALWFLMRGQLHSHLHVLTQASSWKRFAIPTLLGTVVGMWMYMGAFKWAKQGVAAGLTNSVPLFAIPLSVWFLGEKPGWRGWCGAAVVLLGVALVGQMVGYSEIQQK